MDVLSVSDKTAGYRSNLQVGLYLQHKESSFGYKDMEIHHLHNSKTGGALGYYYPFTYEQMKELERQAMIYKYMMASIPVPLDLLVSSTISPYNPRVGGDAEPGRCRRTDGKKWRCSRDVVPSHKYCERHLHRGRPRSRKHVEPSPPSSSTHPRLPYARPSNKPRDLPRLSLGNHTSYGTEPRGNLHLQWDTKKGEIFTMETTPSEGKSKYLNFIDVWSEAVNAPVEQNCSCSTSVSASSVSTTNRNLSLTSLDLSMGGGGGNTNNNNNSVDYEMGRIQMGLGVTGYGGTSPEMLTWLAPATAPGGPLAEILRPRSDFTPSALNPTSPVAGDRESCCLAAAVTRVSLPDSSSQS